MAFGLDTTRRDEFSMDGYIRALREKRTRCVLHTTNGYPMEGIIVGYDGEAVLMDCNGVQKLTCKHAVSTISPSRPVRVDRADP